MLNRSASLVMSTSVLKALPVKLDIKRHSPSIFYFIVVEFQNTERAIKLLDHIYPYETHKIGVIYVGPSILYLLLLCCRVQRELLSC